MSLVSSVGGGLNLSEFQFVDCKFSKCECPSIARILVHQPVLTGRTSNSSKSASVSRFLSSEFQYPPLELVFNSSIANVELFLLGLHPGPKFSSCS
jgi:hypothetical protein